MGSSGRKNILKIFWFVRQVHGTNDISFISVIKQFDALAQQVTTSQLTRVFEAPDRFDAGLELDAEEQDFRPVTFSRCPR